MKTILSLISTVLVACAAMTFAAAHAQSSSAAPSAADAAATLTPGEVRKIDQENRKVTLRHGAIRNLDMPPMTMVFQVRDAALLDQVHVGDKVLFAATLDDGKLTVTKIQAVR
jgi:Cu(I)/Ag(I) efflux system protein CusF